MLHRLYGEVQGFSGFIALRLITLIVFFSVSNALADSAIFLTSPSSPLVLPEGNDFARGELANAWDCNERRDIGWEELYAESSIGIKNGNFVATNASTGAYFFPLFGGFTGALLAEAPEGDKTLPRFGLNHLLNAKKYHYLSFKLKTSSHSSLAVYWAKRNDASTFPDGSNFGAIFDGYYHRGSAFHQGSNTNLIYSFDMRELSKSFQVIKGSWDGQITSLRIDPSISAPAGSSIALDWVRMVDPQSAPTIDITWQARGLPATRIVRVFADSNPAGYGGAQLAIFTDTSDPGAYSLPSASLPPGKYYFYVTAQFEGGSLHSNYSSPVTITAAPQISFGAPTTLSGSDYATSDLHNPWDMNSSKDIANLPSSGLPPSYIQFSKEVFSRGQFKAIASRPLPGAIGTDAQVWMNISQAKPVFSSRYRYLTYRLGVDGSSFGDINDKVANGWVTRAVYWNKDLFLDGGSTKAHTTYEGNHTYTIDLWDKKTVESGLPWKSLPAIYHMRIDPLETTVPTPFMIDWVKLTDENWSANRKFVVKWDITDNDSESISVSVYCDKRGTGYSGSLIGERRDIKPGPQELEVTLPNFTTGSYAYLYLIVSDGINTVRRYAPVPIRIGNAQGKLLRKTNLLDYDGDGISDQVVYRSGTIDASTFFINGSSNGKTELKMPVNSGKPVQLDLDGDGILDPTLVSTVNGYALWTSVLSKSNKVSQHYWGLGSDIPLAGDFSGTGRDSLAVYRPSLGQWYILNSDNSVITRQWGLPGDIPLVADLDRDGKTDLAIYRPQNGKWWLLFGSSFDSPTPNYAQIDWGLNGDLPLISTKLKTNETSLIVFRPKLGTWFLRGLESKRTSQIQWGLPGDIPLLGDYNGDAVEDFTVWRPRNGLWYHNLGNGKIKVVQWGLQGDAIP